VTRRPRGRCVTAWSGTKGWNAKAREGRNRNHTWLLAHREGASEARNDQREFREASGETASEARCECNEHVESPRPGEASAARCGRHIS
jgi:hypothetical protein